jgi:hypothetical protein
MTFMTSRPSDASGQSVRLAIFACTLTDSSEIVIVASVKEPSGPRIGGKRTVLASSSV